MCVAKWDDTEDYEMFNITRWLQPINDRFMLNATESSAYAITLGEKDVSQLADCTDVHWVNSQDLLANI